MNVHDQPTLPSQGKKTDAPPDKTLLPDTVLGDYRLVDEIGRGGMGTVYKAYQVSLDRHVAVKILKSSLARVPDYIQLFRNEAQSAAKMRHPNIVQVYGIGEEKGLHYFVMELVPGKTLKDLIETRSRNPVKTRRIFPVYESLGKAIQIARGLQYAHEKGFLHRDIKPANIIEEEKTFRLMIADFGLSRPLLNTRESSYSGMTGTPPYMAPEVFLGKKWTVSADIYALGATLYNLLTGRPLYEAKTLEELLSLVTRSSYAPPHKINPEVPMEVSALIRKCLEKNPDDRYRTAYELLCDMELFLSDGRTSAFEHYSKLEPPEKEDDAEMRERALRLKKKKIFAWALFAVLLALLVLWGFRRHPGPSTLDTKRSSGAQREKRLEDARNFLLMGRKDLARPILEDICRQNPGTEEGTAASALLKETFPDFTPKAEK